MTVYKNESIMLPEGVTAVLGGNVLTLKGPKGEVSRTFRVPTLTLTITGNKITFGFTKQGKRTKTLINTWAAHIRNMAHGVTQGHQYELKICSGHFPMTVSVKGSQFEVKNFLGEKVPRVLTISQGAQVKIEGEKITVDSTDIERAGQVAAQIEALCRITNRDIRVFQDGIYIIKKSGRDPIL